MAYVVRRRENFMAWKAKVDLQILKLTHGLLNSEGIPDFDYWNAWHSKWTPSSTAQAAIANAKRY